MHVIKEIIVDVLIVGFMWLSTTAGSMIYHGKRSCEAADKAASCVKANSHDISRRATKSNM